MSKKIERPGKGSAPKAQTPTFAVKHPLDAAQKASAASERASAEKAAKDKEAYLQGLSPRENAPLRDREVGQAIGAVPKAAPKKAKPKATVRHKDTDYAT